MKQKFRFAVVLAAALGIGSGVAVSGESDPKDPLSTWTKIETEELGTLAGLGVSVNGDDNLVNEDSNNFTQKNYADNDQENEKSPIIIKSGDGGSSATLATGTIYGDTFLNNRGMFVTSKVSGNLNNVSTVVQFNIYFQ